MSQYTFELRELDRGDAARCAELEGQLFRGETPWSAEVFQQEFAHPHTFYFGVEAAEPVDAADSSGAAGGRAVLVGYAGLAMMGPADAPDFEIHTIGTDPAFQRRGVGRMMMENIAYIADLKDAPVFLEVRVGNDPAIGMYEAFGFKRVGVRKGYYQPAGHDAYTMVRPRKSERESA